MWMSVGSPVSGLGLQYVTPFSLAVTFWPIFFRTITHNPPIARPCHRAIFLRSFFACFLNLVTHPLAHLFRFTPAIFGFHLVFMISTCYSTNDSHELS